MERNEPAKGMAGQKRRSHRPVVRTNLRQNLTQQEVDELRRAARGRGPPRGASRSDRRQVMPSILPVHDADENQLRNRCSSSEKAKVGNRGAELILVVRVE